MHVRKVGQEKDLLCHRRAILHRHYKRVLRARILCTIGRWGKQAISTATDTQQLYKHVIIGLSLFPTRDLHCCRKWLYGTHSSFANPLPPKQTSIRHAMEGMNLFSFFLHSCLAPSNFVASQLLMSGRLAWTPGIFPPRKSKSAGATPVVPTRARI